jgi:hypothetical protein
VNVVIVTYRPNERGLYNVTISDGAREIVSVIDCNEPTPVLAWRTAVNGLMDAGEIERLFTEQWFGENFEDRGCS